MWVHLLKKVCFPLWSYFSGILKRKWWSQKRKFNKSHTLWTLQNIQIKQATLDFLVKLLFTFRLILQISYKWTLITKMFPKQEQISLLNDIPRISNYYFFINIRWKHIFVNCVVELIHEILKITTVVHFLLTH